MLALEGLGPVCFAAAPVPSSTGSTGVTALAVSCPVLLTVNVMVKVWFTFTVYDELVMAEASAAGF